MANEGEIMLLGELFPSSQRRGGRDINKNVAKPPFNGADGVARSASPIGRSLKRRPAKSQMGAELTTPSARNKVASRLLIDRAATPPLRGGECCSSSNRLTPEPSPAYRRID